MNEPGKQAVVCKWFSLKAYRGQLAVSDKALSRSPEILQASALR